MGDVTMGDEQPSRADICKSMVRMSKPFMENNSTGQLWCYQNRNILGGFNGRG